MIWYHTCVMCVLFFFSSRRRHTRCALVTGVQTCALPIYRVSSDVGDLVRTVIVDSTVTCRMKRDAVISNHRIQAGDVIVGLASYGQASYEQTYNGGMGSNGLTSARHDVFNKTIAKRFPERSDPPVPYTPVFAAPKALAYTPDIPGPQTTHVGKNTRPP